MLDIAIVRDNPELVREALIKRQMETSVVDELIRLDAERRRLLTETESLKAERNSVSKQISQAADKNQREAMISAMREVGDKISALDDQVRSTDTALQDLLSNVPNLPGPETPLGIDESENQIIKTVGEPRQFDFKPLPHWELAPKLGILSFEQGVKLSGTRFYVLSGAGARLQRALIAWMLDLHIRQGYREKYLPFMVKGEVLYGAGQLPKFASNLYRDVEEDFWWVPTAEVPLTGIHMNEIMEEESLPRRYTAYTPCFRREKMSAGRDVRGIKRGHQFDKVEMYIYCKPEDTPAEFTRMIHDAEQTCAELGLTYRQVQLCTGDLGFNSHATVDIEVWSPGSEEWLEVSSVSYVGDFQSRRSNIRYKPADGGKNRFTHTLNGSGLGLPRTLIAVMENYQQADGSIVVPDALKPWMGGLDIIEPEA